MAGSNIVSTPTTEAEATALMIPADEALVARPLIIRYIGRLHYGAGFDQLTDLPKVALNGQT